MKALGGVVLMKVAGAARVWVVSTPALLNVTVMLGPGPALPRKATPKATAALPADVV